MNEKYALFVWSSYALAFAVLAWNVLTPWQRRRALKRRMAELAEEAE